MPRSRRRSASGFTLIELMVTLAVLGILAAVGVPAMQALINANRLAGATGELTSALQLARSEAVRRGARVNVCRSADGSTCNNGSTDWSSWIVVGPDVESGNTEVMRNETVAAPASLTGPAQPIEFRPSGLIGAEATLRVCIPTSNPQENVRVVTVLVSGTPVVTRANGSGGCQ